MNKVIAVNFVTQKNDRWSYFGGKGGRSRGNISTYMNGRTNVGVDLSIRRDDKSSAHVRVEFEDIESVRSFINELQARVSSHEESKKQ